MKGSSHERVAQIVDRFLMLRSAGRRLSIDEVLESFRDDSEPGDLAAVRANAVKSIARLRGCRADESAAAPSASAHELAGEVLPELDGYDLIDLLGRGGMGAVYEAYQQSTGRRVAVKLLLNEGVASAAARRRFEREVELIARLQHPAIVSVIDSGVHRGHYFYVMDYVDGQLLDQAVEPGGVDVRPAIQQLIRICEAVEYAHQRGVLHRDLKPSNVLIDLRGQPRVLDFGLGRSFDPQGSIERGASISEPGQLLGTLGYMSPEQARGQSDQTSV